MYPIVFEAFGFQVSSFGVMLTIAFIVGTWIATIRMREEGLDPELSTSFLLYIMIGGIGGSKLYFAIDVSIREGLDFWPLLLSRDGITFYGGLMGGTLAGVFGCWLHSIPAGKFAACMVPTMCVGQALGRVGCFLVGDDYGLPTDLPWGIAFPDGSPPTGDPVHPTQLYEMVWLSVMGWVLWTRRFRSPFIFGEYFFVNGLGRFFIEMWRLNDPVLLNLTEPQIIAIALMLFGMIGWIRGYGKKKEPVP